MMTRLGPLGTKSSRGDSCFSVYIYEETRLLNLSLVFPSDASDFEEVASFFLPSYPGVRRVVIFNCCQSWARTDNFAFGAYLQGAQTEVMGLYARLTVLGSVVLHLLLSGLVG